MDLSSAQLFSAAAQSLVVAVLAFIVYCLVTSFMRFQIAARKATAGVASPTGPAGFEILLSERMAIDRPDGKALALVLATPSEYAQLMADAKDGLAQEMTRFLETRLRQITRAGDLVAACEPGIVGAILRAPPASVDRITARIIDEFTVMPMHAAGDVFLHVAASVGCAVREDRSTGALALIEQARTNMKTGIQPAEISFPALATHHDGGDAEGHTEILDGLSGVIKEEHLPASLQKYFALHRRDAKPMSILYVDIDHLKRYNDQYGKETGDKIIKAISIFLQKETREDDLIGRCGGDEFVVALPVETAPALAIGRRLVSRVKKSVAPSIGAGLKFAISVGVAGFPEHGTTSQQLFKAAHAAMRAVKARGRNSAGLPEAAPAEAEPIEPPAQRDVF